MKLKMSNHNSYMYDGRYFSDGRWLVDTDAIEIHVPNKFVLGAMRAFEAKSKKVIEINPRQSLVHIKQGEPDMLRRKFVTSIRKNRQVSVDTKILYRNTSEFLITFFAAKDIYISISEEYYYLCEGMIVKVYDSNNPIAIYRDTGGIKPKLIPWAILMPMRADVVDIKNWVKGIFLGQGVSNADR